MRWQQETVEALVAPLPAREAVKERLREELWAHLADLFQEELARSGDMECAKAAACVRIGTADALQYEYLRWAAPTGRMESRLLQILQSDPNGRAPRAFAFATILLATLSFTGLSLSGMTPPSAFLTWLTGTMLAALVVSTFEVMTRRGSALRGLLIHTTTATATALLAYGIALAVFRATDHLEMLDVLNDFTRLVYAPSVAISLIGAPALARTAAWREYRARKLSNWPYSTP